MLNDFPGLGLSGVFGGLLHPSQLQMEAALQAGRRQMAQTQQLLEAQNQYRVEVIKEAEDVEITNSEPKVVKLLNEPDGYEWI